jgi:hypothetical protein
MVQPDFPNLPPDYDTTDDNVWKYTEEHKNTVEVQDKKMDNPRENPGAIVPYNVAAAGTTIITAQSANSASSSSMKACKLSTCPKVKQNLQHLSGKSVTDGFSYISACITCRATQSAIKEELKNCNFETWQFKKGKYTRNCAQLACKIVADAYTHCELTMRRVRSTRMELNLQSAIFTPTMNLLEVNGSMDVVNNNT